MESGQAQCGALTAIKEMTAWGEEEADIQTDGRSLAEEQDGTPPSPANPKKKTSQPDTGPRSEGIS